MFLTVLLGLSLLVCAAAPAIRFRPAFLDLRIDADALHRHPILTAVALAVLLIPEPSKRAHADLFTLSHEFAWQRGMVSFERDYDKLARIGNLQTTLPLPLVLFIRHQIGPNHVFATAPTELNRLVIFTNSYVSNAPSQIATYLDVEHFDLVRQLGADPLFNDRPLKPKEAIIQWYLQRYGIEYVLVNPSSRDRMERELPTLQSQGPLFTRIYDRDGWTIWKVDRRYLAPPLQSLLRS